MIERLTRAVNSINVFGVFCSCHTGISAVSSAALPCKRFFTMRLGMHKQFVHSLSMNIF